MEKVIIPLPWRGGLRQDEEDKTKWKMSLLH